MRVTRPRCVPQTAIPNVFGFAKNLRGKTKKQIRIARMASAFRPEAAVMTRGNTNARPEKCPRPVEEAFEAATSVLEMAISRAVDSWLELVFDRQVRHSAVIIDTAIAAHAYMH